MLTERQQKLVDGATLKELYKMRKWAKEVIESWDSLEQLLGESIWSELVKDLDCHIKLINQMKHFREAFADLQIAIKHKKQGESSAT